MTGQAVNSTVPHMIDQKKGVGYRLFAQVLQLFTAIGQQAVLRRIPLRRDGAYACGGLCRACFPGPPACGQQLPQRRRVGVEPAKRANRHFRDTTNRSDY